MEAKLVLAQRANHEVHVRERLRLLRFLVVEGQLRLSLPALQAVWTSLLGGSGYRRKFINHNQQPTSHSTKIVGDSSFPKISMTRNEASSIIDHREFSGSLDEKMNTLKEEKCSEKRHIEEELVEYKGVDDMQVFTVLDQIKPERGDSYQ
ncbi:unnamed protein product, partial [Protopolystoma xenopodis]